MWLQSQHCPRCIWDVPLTHHPVSQNTKGNSWPHFGSSWTQLPFKVPQITCLISLSKMIPEITIESADWGLRIPDFFDNWYLFPHLSLLAFLLISRFPQNSWQQSHGYHRKFSAYPETSCVWPAVFAISGLSTLLAHDLLHCRRHQFLLNDVDSAFPSVKITIPSLDRNDNQAHSSVFSVIWAMTSPSPGYRKLGIPQKKLPPPGAHSNPILAQEVTGKERPDWLPITSLLHRPD